MTPRDELDDLPLAAQLKSLESDAPAADTEALERIAQLAGQAFEQSAAVPSSPVIVPASSLKPPRSRTMISMMLKVSLALIAAIGVGVAWFTTGPQHDRHGLLFADVLANLRQADTLQLTLSRGSAATEEILVRFPQQVRWQEGPTRYRIAQGTRLYWIDEFANTVAYDDAPWLTAARQEADVLNLLALDNVDYTPLLTAEPVEQQVYLGRECLTYVADVHNDQTAWHVTAFADTQSHQLLGITAVPRGEKQQPVELRLVAVNPPVDEAQFVVAKSLTEDGRIGKITESQGVVTLRSVTSRRWTPVCREVLLKPSDWIKTESRGANAVAVTLTSDTVLTIGPGSLVECVSPTEARLHHGELQVHLAEAVKPRFELLGPKDGGQVLTKSGKHMFRTDRADKLLGIEHAPPWLAGFEGTTTNESLGSLIANVDGRNEPLTIGYHKVHVDIRDQIARTTIEESFVNHTPGRLEGQFLFPLPQDASISGFGMWIGNELVEADIVEKERAREIYETILREKRDPGLLEWTTGNLFKARVFPIEPHSEKRVKIVYTQVLPLRGNKFRYSYGLRSEMLQTKPMRELSLSVLVNSTIPLKNADCPTHAARTTVTAKSAQLEFTAEDYSPNRDFEVVCEIDGRQSEVVLAPHRRGSDGYFLVQITPPGGDPAASRDLISNSEPLDVLLVCDTSASMDREQRRQQQEFVSAVLAALGRDDTFNLAATDVETVWISPQSQAVTDATKEQALKFLDERLSLGWTDLDRAFPSIWEHCGEKSQVIYIGDGIVTTAQSDPQAFVNRLEELRSRKKAGIFHAVSVGNTSEAVVLKEIAAMGRGSWRSITGEQTPQQIALELLHEITEPGLRDIRVEFRGVETAAVYPERLPNIAAGTQQILVGRYLPDAKHSTGEIIVTGYRDEEVVKYVGQVMLPERPSPEEDASFIPRLWARAHLDHLLQQGSGKTIQDEIIGLSEEFHIITPYTSLLVLETDADRERFGVKRRYEMRDGQQFFAKGRDNAQYELVRDQMKRSGDWRIGLRRKVLRQLAGLGRNPRFYSQSEQQRYSRLLGPNLHNFTEYGRRSSGQHEYFRSMDLGGLGSRMEGLYGMGGAMGGMGGGMGGMGGGMGGGENLWGTRVWDESGFDVPVLSTSGSADSLADLSISDFDGIADQRWDKSEKDNKFSGFSLDLLDEDSLERLSAPWSDDLAVVNGRKGFRRMAWDAAPYGNRHRYYDESLGFDRDIGAMDGEYLHGNLGGLSLFGMPAEPGFLGYVASSGRLSSWSYASSSAPYQPDYTQWMNTLFPVLAPPVIGPVQSAKPRFSWPDDVEDVVKSLSRRASLEKLEGGLEIRRATDHYDVRWNRTTSHAEGLELYSPKAWLTRPLSDGVETVINWCNGDERGVLSRAFLLGRVRKSVNHDFEPPLALADYSLSSLHDAFANYDGAKLEPAGDHRVLLSLTAKSAPEAETRVLIDTQRHVVLKTEMLTKGDAFTTTTFDDFIEVAGSWWARSVVTADGKGRVTSKSTQTVALHAAEKYRQRMTEELTARSDAQLLSYPLPKLKAAIQHAADGVATFEDRLLLIVRDCRRQQWDAVFTGVDQLEQLAANKPGVRWIRTAIQAVSRRHEDARHRLLGAARQLAQAPQPDDMHLTRHILQTASALFDANEMLPLVELVQPVYVRQPEYVQAASAWQEERLRYLSALNRPDESLALERQLAEAQPWDIYKQTRYAQSLTRRGEWESAYGWLQRQLDRPEEREPWEREQFYSTYADLLFQESRYPALLEFTSQWMVQMPESATACKQHLSALVLVNDVPAAYRLVEQWLKEARIESKLPTVVRIHCDCALEFTLGSVPRINVNRMDARWETPLAETARYFLLREHDSDIARTIINHYYFAQSDEMGLLRFELLNRLQDEAATMPADRVQQFVGWTLSGFFKTTVGDRKELQAGEISVDVWRKIAAAIRPRWEASQSPDDQQLLGDTLISIYSSRLPAEHLPFLRARVARLADDPVRLSAARRQLFDALLATEWKAETEVELFAMLPQLFSEEPLPLQRIRQAEQLLQMIDALLAKRLAADEQHLRTTEKIDEMTGQELQKKRAALAQTGREQMAARLATLAAQPGPLAAWYRMERGYLDLQLQRNQDQVLTDCWELLGEIPPKPAPDDLSDVDNTEEPIDPDVAAERATQAFVDAVLRQRALTVAMNLAARKSAQPEQVQRVMKYLDAGIAHGEAVAAAWRNLKYRFLIALDRPDELEQQLRTWIEVDESTAPWNIQLARLLAERGKLDEAIGLFEAAQAARLLLPSDLAVLAGWYQARDRRADFERTRVESYKLQEEWQLSQHVQQYQYRDRSQDSGSAAEIDAEILFALKALFEKSGSPENYLWMLRELYKQTQDFRLLEMVPDAMIGRTPQQIYNVLNTARQSVLAEIRNEATADALLARIVELRKPERTAVDLRALDLLESLVETQASHVLNQPGPHVERSVAAMQRAFQREWAGGEPRQMAQYLSNLGNMPHPPLQTEQISELQRLTELAEPGTATHLFLQYQLAHCLYWHYNRKEEALSLMQPTMQAYLQPRNGVWAVEDQETFSNYIAFLEHMGRFAAGERLIKESQQRPINPPQGLWYEERLNRLYSMAVSHDGEVSLGKGDKLFRTLIDRIAGQIRESADQNHRSQLFSTMMDTINAVRERKLPSAADVMRSVAFEFVPYMMKRQLVDYRSTVDRTHQMVHLILGPREALKFLIERIELYPGRYEFSWENPWGVYSSSLGYYRRLCDEQKLELGELDARLFAIVERELRRDLSQRELRSGTLYRVDYGDFWAVKSAAYARIAEEVLDQRSASGRTIFHIAGYFRHGLRKTQRCIEILFQAHQRGLLDDSQQQQLITWLHDDQRYGESIALLEPMVKRYPDQMTFRIQLMTAYCRTDRNQQLTQLVRETHDHFHQGQLWTEGNIANLASGCLGCHLLESAVSYFHEAISTRKRTSGARAGDETLAGYYRELADAESQLGHTKLAVDAASNAVVTWGPTHHERQDALNRLHRVLSEAQDLDDYVGEFDEETRKSKQDAPLLRKLIGRVYFERQEFAKAVTHLKLAAELQPNDRETHDLLVQSYDALGDAASGTKELLAQIALDRRNLDLYRKLTQRLQADPVLAERAATSIVEVAPLETENHTALAELRQQQDRWKDAISHWERVAELRTLEPTGLLMLAEAQLHEEDWPAAKKSLEKLDRTEWPTRFNTVREQTRSLWARIPAGK